MFGLFPNSSGKTVVSIALARGLSNEGVKVGVFKPRSGHNMWYQYGAFLKCKVEEGLFCEDIIKLKEASECPLPYEVLNPVDALMSPLNVETFLGRNLTNRMYFLEPEMYPHLIVERYTFIKDKKTENVLLLNEKSINASLVLLDHDYLVKLREKASKIIPVHNLDEWAILFKKLAPSSICSCYKMVRQMYENLIIEGFNDAVSPELRILDDVNVVVGVAPSAAIFYDPKELKRVIDTMMKLGKDPRALRAKETVKFMRACKTLKIPPLPQEYLIDYDKLSKKLKIIIKYVKSCLEQ